MNNKTIYKVTALTLSLVLGLSGSWLAFGQESEAPATATEAMYEYWGVDPEDPNAKALAYEHLQEMNSEEGTMATAMVIDHVCEEAGISEEGKTGSDALITAAFGSSITQAVDKVETVAETNNVSLETLAETEHLSFTDKSLASVVETLVQDKQVVGVLPDATAQQFTTEVKVADQVVTTLEQNVEATGQYTVPGTNITFTKSDLESGQVNNLFSQAFINSVEQGTPQTYFTALQNLGVSTNDLAQVKNETAAEFGLAISSFAQQLGGVPGVVPLTGFNPAEMAKQFFDQGGNVGEFVDQHFAKMEEYRPDNVEEALGMYREFQELASGSVEDQIKHFAEERGISTAQVDVNNPEYRMFQQALQTASQYNEGDVARMFEGGYEADGGMGIRQFPGPQPTFGGTENATPGVFTEGMFEAAREGGSTMSREEMESNYNQYITSGGMPPPMPPVDFGQYETQFNNFETSGGTLFDWFGGSDNGGSMPVPYTDVPGTGGTQGYVPGVGGSTGVMTPGQMTDAQRDAASSMGYTFDAKSGAWSGGPAPTGMANPTGPVVPDGSSGAYFSPIGGPSMPGGDSGNFFRPDEGGYVPTGAPGATPPPGGSWSGSGGGATNFFGPASGGMPGMPGMPGGYTGGTPPPGGTTPPPPPASLWEIFKWYRAYGY